MKYQNTSKWKIMEEFEKGKRPHEIDCPYVEQKTIYNYFWEWKQWGVVEGRPHVEAQKEVVT